MHFGLFVTALSIVWIGYAGTFLVCGVIIAVVSLLTKCTAA